MSDARTAGRSFSSRSPAASVRAARHATRSGRLLLAHRLKDEVLAEVPHRQWVFTIPKRLRVYFRYDRKLLGKLCRAAYDTVCDVFEAGDRRRQRPSRHGRGGADIRRSHTLAFAYSCHRAGGRVHGVRAFRAYPRHLETPRGEIWQEKVFDLLLDEVKIDMEIVANMRGMEAFRVQRR